MRYLKFWSSQSGLTGGFIAGLLLVLPMVWLSGVPVHPSHYLDALLVVLVCLGLDLLIDRWLG